MRDLLSHYHPINGTMPEHLAHVYRAKPNVYRARYTSRVRSPYTREQIAGFNTLASVYGNYFPGDRSMPLSLANVARHLRHLPAGGYVLPFHVY